MKTKKTFLIFFLVLLVFVLIPVGLHSKEVPGGGTEPPKVCDPADPSCTPPSPTTSRGLVPCGPGTGPSGADVPCTLCHFFILFQNIVNFILFDVVPPLAVLMIVIGGFLMMFAFFGPGGEGGPEYLNKAKGIFRAVGWGLLIIYGAWMLVNLVLTFPGFINPNFASGWNPANWYIINCSVP